jgi:hypothetical protein
MARCFFGAPLTLLPSSAGFAQNFPAKALSFASHLIAALPGRHAINNGMLTRRVTWIDRSDTETGSAPTLALGTGESRIDFVPAIGTRTGIRDASAGVTQSHWVAQEGFSGLVYLSELPDECGVFANPWLSEPRSPAASNTSPQRLTNYHGVSRIIIPCTFRNTCKKRWRLTSPCPVPLSTHS